MYIKVAVKALSAHDATLAEASTAEQELNSRAYAAQACSQVVRVFAHCTKDRQKCLVTLPHRESLVTKVEGKLTHSLPNFVCLLDLRVISSSLDSSECFDNQAVFTLLPTSCV